MRGDRPPGSRGLDALLALLLLLAPAAAAPQGFTEIARAAGITHEHGFGGGALLEAEQISGGVAAGDVDGDGWPDLYAVQGPVGPNLLYRNRGDGTFEEVAAAWGVAIEGKVSVGPALADLEGDGDLDLLLAGIGGAAPRVFWNTGRGRFEEEPGSAGLFSLFDSYSYAFADHDRDGDLDVFLSHWLPGGGVTPHLWRNDGTGRFGPVDFLAGIAPAYAEQDFSFTPNFGDLDGDGWPDLVVAGDFGTSKVFHNQGDGTFLETTGPEITDENGMGAALGDYDGDGDLDWFVSSIWDPDGVAEGNWGVSGNRLYRNRGDGSFEDATEEAGVRHGYWGWGSCFADFDLDGHLDLFHTNGFPAGGTDAFDRDPSRLFLGNGDGTFRERSAELGIVDREHGRGQGRGIACFDFDRDGDLDLYVANHSGPPELYRNDLAAGAALGLRLRGGGRNSEAVGARIILRTGGREQVREIRAGNHYLSQSPAEAHFGLGSARRVDELEIRWPDGEVSLFHDLPATPLLTLRQHEVPVPEVPALDPGGLAVLALLLLAAGLRVLSRGVL